MPRGLVVALAGLSALWLSQATALESDEYTVKAAFIYNFAKFVEWPEGAFDDTATPIDLCIIGGSGIREKISTIADKRAQGRSFNVHVIAHVHETAFCHIAYFIAESNAEKSAAPAKGKQPEGVLTIGDAPGFVEGGGIIAFVVTNNKVQFRINLDAADRAHLRISSKLLQLAEIYREGR